MKEKEKRRKSEASKKNTNRKYLEKESRQQRKIEGLNEFRKTV